MTRKKKYRLPFFSFQKRRMFFPPSSAFILSRPSWMLSGFFRGFLVIQPISHCIPAFSPLVDELRRWRHQWKAETSTGPYRKANWPWYGIASFFDSIQLLLLLLDFAPLEEEKKGLMCIQRRCSRFFVIRLLTCFFHPFNVVASALLHTQRIEKFGEPSKNKSKKARPRLSIVSFSTLQTPQHQTRLPVPTFPSCFYSVIEVEFPSQGVPPALFLAKKSISDSIYPSENK